MNKADQSRATLLIKLELESRLYNHLKSADRLMSQLRLAISVEFDRLFTSAGISSTASVKITSFNQPSTDLSYCCRLYVNDQVCRYPVYIPLMVFRHVTRNFSNIEDVREWICPEEKNKRQPKRATNVQILKFFTELCHSIFYESPDVFLSIEATRSYKHVLAAHIGSGTDLPDDDSLHKILTSLLSQQISLTDRQRIATLIKDHSERLGTDGTIEYLANFFRSAHIDIVLSKDYLAELVRDAPLSSTAIFSQLRDDLFNRQGLRVPAFQFATAAIDDNCFAFRFNSFISATYLGLPRGKVLVNADVDQLRALKIPGSSLRDTTSGYEYVLIDARHAAKVHRMGYITWDSLEYIALCLGAELKRFSSSFINFEVIERDLSLLESSHPDLVSAVRSTHSTSRIVDIFRRLVQEEFSIRNLRLIYERLLNYDHLVVKSFGQVVFDDRLTCPREPATEDEEIDNIVSFIRMGSRYYISDKYRIMGHLFVYRPNRSLEERVFQSASTTKTLTENESSEIIDSLCRTLVNHSSYYNIRQVILTSAEIRSAFRHIIRRSLPNVAVVSFNELSPDTKIDLVNEINFKNQLATKYGSDHSSIGQVT